jgi:hypothetical protein
MDDMVQADEFVFNTYERNGPSNLCMEPRLDGAEYDISGKSVRNIVNIFEAKNVKNEMSPKVVRKWQKKKSGLFGLMKGSGGKKTAKTSSSIIDRGGDRMLPAVLGENKMSFLTLFNMDQ